MNGPGYGSAPCSRGFLASRWRSWRHACGPVRRQRACGDREIATAAAAAMLRSFAGMLQLRSLESCSSLVALLRPAVWPEARVRVRNRALRPTRQVDRLPRPIRRTAACWRQSAGESRQLLQSTASAASASPRAAAKRAASQLLRRHPLRWMPRRGQLPSWRRTRSTAWLQWPLQLAHRALGRSGCVARGSIAIGRPSRAKLRHGAL